jgi:hypothetical protein
MNQGCYFCGTMVCTARDKFSTAAADGVTKLICHSCTGKLDKIKSEPASAREQLITSNAQRKRSIE